MKILIKIKGSHNVNSIGNEIKTFYNTYDYYKDRKKCINNKINDIILQIDEKLETIYKYKAEIIYKNG